MVQRNWLLGKRISDEELQGENRAEYGKEIIKRLSAYLTNLYGKIFTSKMKTVLLALALFSQQGHELCPADEVRARAPPSYLVSCCWRMCLTA